MNIPQYKEIYDSANSPGPAVEEIKAVLRNKDLMAQLIKRDLVTRYKRSVLGVFWSMLNPLGTMIILSLVFSRMFDMRGVYPAYILTNYVAWNFFSQSTQFSLNTTLWGSDLFHKIYIPRTSFILSTVGTGMLNLTFALVPLFLILLITGVSIHLTILFLPLAVLILAAFALGFSLLLSTLVVFFPDVNEFYPVLLTAWMYLTPIIYPETMISDVLNGWLLRLNPLYHLIKIFRLVVFEGVVPSGMEWLVAVIFAVITLTAGWVVFTSSNKRFGYYV